jgi:outer membrane receptor protein involved in Fe transport
MKIRGILLTFCGLLTFASQVFGENVVEEVVVTGSYIARDIEEQQIPVDVIGRDEFLAAGSPQIIDILDNLPSLAGGLNRSEQYIAGGVATGTKNANIRGLGPDRTLVLLNGKRIINSAARPSKNSIYAVDVGNLPMIALERIELLQNGGAITYGSDAMAGVFNFITRTEFDGFDLSYTRSDYSGSDGDMTFGMIFGKTTDQSYLTVAFEMEERKVFPTAEFDRRRDDINHDGSWPIGKSSFGNPGTWYTSAKEDPIRDPACGYENTPEKVSFENGVRCGYSYVPFVAIVEPQERKKIFAAFGTDISDSLELYGEVLWSKLDSEYWASPSYPPTSPGAGYYTTVPDHNPGLQDFVSGLDAATAANYSGGAEWWGRSLAVEGPVSKNPRTHETKRFLAGIKGSVGEYTVDLSVNYSTTDFYIATADILTDRFDQAMYGLAGFDCKRASSDVASAANDALRGDTAQGCHYFIPSGSSIGAAPGDALYNDPAMRDYITGVSSSDTHNELLVFDLVVSGSAPITLAGGNIEWAAGAQSRYFDGIFEATGDNRCDGPCETPFHFLGTDVSSTTTNRQWAAFVEAMLPVTDSLAIDVGLRYLDYDLDTMVAPKISGRWEVTDNLALRASYQEVFRSPIVPSSDATALELYAPSGEYLTIVTPVPSSLTPEESDNISVGAILKLDSGLQIGLDYYSLAMTGPISREASTCDCATIFKGDGTVYDPAVDDLASIARIEAELINGDDVDTSGLDLQFSYPIESEAFGGTYFEVGGNMNYLLDFDVEGADGSTIEAAGKWNTRSTVLPIELQTLPEIRANAYLSATSGIHSARLFVRYRGDADVPDTFSGAAAFPTLTKIDSFTTVDAHYSVSLMDDAAEVTLSVMNAFDEEPPLAPSEPGYDAYTHNPQGRIYKVGLTYSF